MIKKLLTAAAVCAALTGGAAHASSTYDFSYTFSDGQEITGSLIGTSTDGGQAVTDISNLQVSFDGVAFAGGVSPTLILNTWNPSTVSFNSASSPTTLFVNGALNNFVISDVDASVNTSPDYEFAYVNDATNNIFQATGANFLQGQVDVDTPANAAAWSLTAVATPVPLPAGLPLLASSLAGLGLFGIGRRRVAR
jgi:hypothetical protein